LDQTAGWREPHMRTRLAVLLVLTFLPAAAARAQPVNPPRVSIGAGLGLALPFHGDLDFTPWAWDADVRIRLARRGLLEVAVGEWRHSESRVVENIQVTPPPGAIGRLEQTTSRAQRMLQASLLFEGATGRLRVAGGGGVGLLQLNRRTRTITTGCSPEVSCGASTSAFTNAAPTTQVLGGVEVTLGGGVAVHGQARFIVNLRDVGGSETRLTAGVRWRFGG
jgi:hypothetical protein